MQLLIDDATWHTDEYILRYKSETVEKFKEWKAVRKKELGNQVKRFRTDGGGEYTSKKLAEYLKPDGILTETTRPYTPQSNGVIQRVNRTIMDCIVCMLNAAGRLKKYWVFAVSVAVYLKNRTQTHSVVGEDG
jgi:transposase InsO family protein